MSDALAKVIREAYDNWREDSPDSDWQDHIAAAVAAHAIGGDAVERAMTAYATEANNWMHSTRHAPGTIARHPSGEIVDTGGLRFDKFVEREQVRAAIRAAIGGDDAP